MNYWYVSLYANFSLWLAEICFARLEYFFLLICESLSRRCWFKCAIGIHAIFLCVFVFCSHLNVITLYSFSYCDQIYLWLPSSPRYSSGNKLKNRWRTLMHLFLIFPSVFVPVILNCTVQYSGCGQVLLSGVGMSIIKLYFTCRLAHLPLLY